MRVALTFDTEHPGRPAPNGVDVRILDILRESGVRATFFLQGRWARSSPDIARRIADEGHLIGNHSNYHAPMDALTEEGFRHDVRKAEETIRRVTGIEPRPWFRCPFGAGIDNARVLEALAALGYTHVGWDVDPTDWDESQTARGVEEAILAGIRAREEDSIVLMHSWPAATCDALPAVLAGLRDAGAELVSVDELALG